MLTRHYEMNSGIGIPAEPHRVAQNQLRLRALEEKVLAALRVVANQSVDVVRQTQQLAIGVLQLQLQEVAAAPVSVHTLNNIKHANQCESPVCTVKSDKYVNDNM